MKRVILFFLFLSMMYPIYASATSPPYVPPTMGICSPVAIPFPTNGSDVGVISASLNFLLADGNLPLGRSQLVPYTNLAYSGEYTIRYSGDEPQTIEIAVPTLDTSTATPQITVDGEAVDTSVYFQYSKPLQGARGIYDSWEYISIADFVKEIQSQDKQFTPRNFDADTSAKLYSIAFEGPDDTHIGFEITLGYDPARTTLLINAPFNMEPKTNYFVTLYDETDLSKSLGNGHYYGEAYTVQFKRPESFEVLVLGEDTLTWRVYDQNMPENPSGSSLRVTSVKEEVPRDFIKRVQDNLCEFTNAFEYPIGPDDYLIRYVDQMLEDQSKMQSNVIHSFANLRSIDKGISNDKMWQQIPYQKALVAAVHFDPGQECVLRVSYTPIPGFWWNEMKQQSTFYYIVYTDPARYWDYFDSLSVAVEHPKETLEATFGNGYQGDGAYGYDFITENDASSVNIKDPPEQNIYMAFSVPDERTPPPTDWGLTGAIFLMLAIRYWPIIVLAIIMIVIVIRALIKRKQRSQD